MLQTTAGSSDSGSQQMNIQLGLTVGEKPLVHKPAAALTFVVFALRLKAALKTEMKLSPDPKSNTQNLMCLLTVSG